MLLEGRAMSRSAPALLTAACCALAACAPTTDEATSVVVLAYQPELERYDRHVVQLHTIDDIVTLKGSVAEVIGGAELDFDAATIDGLVGNVGLVRLLKERTHRKADLVVFHIDINDLCIYFVAYCQYVSRLVYLSVCDL